MELRYELPTGPRTRVPLDGYVKGTLSIHESSNVSIQPFLLIVRTWRIVTLHDQRLTITCDTKVVAQDTRRFQHIAEFIDSAYVHCLTTF